MFTRKNYIGVNIPQCWICNKRTAVLNIIIAGGPFVEVCDECIKFGEKVGFGDVDSKMNHSEFIEVVNIKPKK
jgi:ribosome-binding protein aMBF1 (putative translation factor)